jgi:hypothetical protein
MLLFQNFLDLEIELDPEESPLEDIGIFDRARIIRL